MFEVVRLLPFARSMLSISLVVASSCFYRLLGIVGLPLLHLYGCKGCRRGPAAVINFFYGGFC